MTYQMSTYLHHNLPVSRSTRCPTTTPSSRDIHFKSHSRRKRHFLFNSNDNKTENRYILPPSGGRYVISKHPVEYRRCSEAFYA